ncbi:MULTISPECIES: HAD-IIIC family phosphatase [Rhodopseudomonas]|uniref:HAD-IIIC family phosphatase n=1 Tax=Rhodopseudomonas TaxID=1073 RepID=UPI0005C83103|nr:MULTISPECIES: HAD-IIIC family phosphatase [Rhodopseudomonas]MDF3812582.1 HAD-IIIC family phosphatase [Rhodopseudomonas sp. BAL398]WOK17686.1 HAD-IIIC family phosphatase [Rhodopseudomonas sp. BAL398]
MEQPLAWLPRHPDLVAEIRRAKADDAPDRQFAAACRLAGMSRDFVATERIDRLATSALDRLGPGHEADFGLASRRVALLGSHTLGHLAAGIRVAGLARRLALQVFVGSYNSYRQELLNGDPALAHFAPDFIVLALDEHALGLSFPPDIDGADLDAEIDRELDEIRQLWRCIRERYGAQPVQQTLVCGTTLPVFGNYEGLVPGAGVSVVESFNAKLRQAAREDKVLLLDLAWEAARRGFIPDLVHPVRWHQAKQLVSPPFAPFFGDLLARVVAAASGLSRKVLVLDLDNTLWGGVVGDDGVGGLRLGQGCAEGEAYVAFQRYVAMLGGRGVVLAVCSKNDPDLAETAFTTHPDMVLKRDDIAVFVANWDDKATNIRKIARTLDIGLDSLVFVDDNPAEREIVRREIAEVAVPELPEDVAYYPRCLADAGYFEASSFTADDVSRSRSYAARGRRLAEIEEATDLDGYLRGLCMTMSVESVGSNNISRVTQLINKTNQFNLTTRRYSEVQVEKFVATPGNIGLAFRLRDRLDDAGLIAVILAQAEEAGALRIDSWLMSCRVLGRRVEAASLEALVQVAGLVGATGLIGEYIPTARNALVAPHYESLGFAPLAAREGQPEGATNWYFKIGERLPTHNIVVDVCPSVVPPQTRTNLLRRTA